MDKKLFLVDGASGTGKTDLIEYLLEYKADAINVKKYTTRKLRKQEERLQKYLDLIHISEEEFKNKNFDYIYKYGGNYYGIFRKDIRERLHQYENVFVIVRDKKIIQSIKKDFLFLDSIAIYIYTDNNLIAKRLKDDGYNQDDVKFRLERLKIAYNSYLQNPFAYDDVIVNSGLKEDYKRIINGLIDKHEQQIHIDPEYLFVLMPFDDEYDNLLLEFKVAAKAVNNNLTVERASEEYGSYEVLHQIFRNIQKASLIICDLSDERPNVYLEAGYAIAMNKKIIFCIKKGTTKHFDLQGYKMIEYNDVTKLKEKLMPEIKNHYTGV